MVIILHRHRQFRWVIPSDELLFFLHLIALSLSSTVTYGCFLLFHLVLFLGDWIHTHLGGYNGILQLYYFLLTAEGLETKQQKFNMQDEQGWVLQVLRPTEKSHFRLSSNRCCLWEISAFVNKWCGIDGTVTSGSLSQSLCCFPGRTDLTQAFCSLKSIVIEEQGLSPA